ncbi:hypothetical protein PYCCODRAFT_1434021 [Trametes coccinea BRFM310]|uniref:Uncharacterized protein n=1 Tax=Trametes coccinea (strain BRFM310) TaxID=1353009 RepID=A0A1Y2IW09_TRAC3|nr:hypothetical protein PYCCODRAFT_1434021 [Trametes coccinea BRFM310]
MPRCPLSLQRLPVTRSLVAIWCPVGAPGMEEAAARLGLNSSKKIVDRSTCPGEGRWMHHRLTDREGTDKRFREQTFLSRTLLRTAPPQWGNDEAYSRTCSVIQHSSCPRVCFEGPVTAILARFSSVSPTPQVLTLQML